MDANIPNSGAKSLYRFGCRDVGANCDFVAAGTSVEEVKNKWFAHAEVAHVDILNKMDETQKAELTQRVVTRIKQSERTR